MDEDRGGPIALTCALMVGAVTYLLVAPFRCSADGACDGLLAFHYQADSSGHWQAIAAGAVVGAVVGLLLWLLLAPEGPWLIAAKGIASALLVGALGLSLFSHSILVVAGPFVTGLVLWLMWGRRPTPDNHNAEPEPFSARV